MLIVFVDYIYSDHYTIITMFSQWIWSDSLDFILVHIYLVVIPVLVSYYSNF